MQPSLIADVSDTAIWVAHYRAKETERPDALFSDPFAKRLAGDKGKNIAEHMPTSWMVDWSVVIRTRLIDDWIRELINRGIDTIVNLGAGLDSRPYRLNLPSSLKWIEIDHPHLIEFKNQKLLDDKASCELRRIGLDLSKRKERNAIFDNIASSSKNILVLTEGVVPYLSQEHVAELATDLITHLKCRHWILEYISPTSTKRLQMSRIRKVLKNAPFQFNPPDWFAFFKEQGWQQSDIRYLSDESAKLGREIPMPLWIKCLTKLMPKETLKRFSHSWAYTIMEPLSE